MDRLYWPRTRQHRSFQSGFASLDSPPSPAGASEQGLRAFGPELLPPGIAWGAPAASRGRVLALWAAGRTNPLTRHPLDGTATDVVWPGVVSRAGGESKGRSNRCTLRQSGRKKASPEARPPSRNANVTGQAVCPSIRGSPARIRRADHSQKLAHHPVAMFVVFPVEFDREQVRIGGSRFQ